MEGVSKFEVLASASSGFDVEAATRAYLDTLQGPARDRSDAYFEGGYWLILWGTGVIGAFLFIMAMMMLVIALGLFAASRIAPWLIARYGERWGVRAIGDPASMPVLGIVMGMFFFAATPAFNNITRIQENEADAFGLEAAKEPDGFARAAMRLSEYRKLEPGAVEEFLFYTHPSGENRVRRSMQWKADHVPGATIETPPAGYLD